MKKLLILLVVCCSSITLMAHTDFEVSEKVKKAFKEAFPDATGVNWYESGNIYHVRFFRNGIDNRVDYGTEGNVILTTRYYNEKHLPTFLISKLKKKYSDKKIHLVTELNNLDGLEYHITLHDEKSWYVVKAYANGSMMVYNKYNKQ